MRRQRFWLGTLIGLVIGTQACRPPGASAPGSASPPPAGGSRVASRGNAAPDSVLAQVGKDRTITISDFRRAWSQLEPPSRPDSLTPETGRQFLDLLVGKEVLAARAAAGRWHWSAQESTQYASIRDRLTLKVVLDSVLGRAREDLGARGDSVRGPEALGIAARESTMAKLELSFDEPLVEHLALAWKAIPEPPADSGLWAKLRVMGAMPVVDAADTGKAVARSSEGPFTVAELIESWRRLSPLYRPRVHNAGQMRDVIKNALYERMLRAIAIRQGHASRPEIAAQLATQRELNDVTHLVESEVYGKIATDSLTLLARYRETIPHWRLPERLLVARFVLPDRRTASQMAVRLRMAGEAESLIAMARRQRIDYSGEISAETDSALFRLGRTAGAGAVIGPDSVARGWQVVRVMEIRLPRDRTFEEVRVLVHHEWHGVEGERRMRALIADLRKRTRVVINQRALRKLLATSASS
ncbi:MAG TPA: peptidylprolyl isomerase [Candidatus Limnocylindria bacterium]|nr:peptidylprolyl isomerase [Candidatus Limnocylindria bacterium]